MNWHTEEEAREKWCPLANDKGSLERQLGIRNRESLRCIGSECAMWVWKPKADLTVALELYRKYGSNVSQHLVEKALADMERQDELGGCGLRVPR